jgi:dephospho-CoA kinase
MYTVGLTGSIGSGKTTVSQIFKRHGVTVFDADDIAKQITDVGEPGWLFLQSYLHADYFNKDRTLNRRKLREAIFSDKYVLLEINKNLHPLIRDRLLSLKSQLHPSPYMILDIPLLFEAKWERHVNRTLLVYASLENQIERVCLRDKIKAEEVKKVIDAQLPVEEKIKYADDLIENNTNLIHLERSVEQLHQQYLKNSVQ